MLIMVIILGYIFHWDWNGLFGGYPKITTKGKITESEQPPAKTLWDWLLLLAVIAIPLAAGLGAAWFTAKFNEQQNLIGHVIASDNQRETALQEYIKAMSELLLVQRVRSPSLGKLSGVFPVLVYRLAGKFVQTSITLPPSLGAPTTS